MVEPPGDRMMPLAFATSYICPSLFLVWRQSACFTKRMMILFFSTFNWLLDHVNTGRRHSLASKGSVCVCVVVVLKNPPSAWGNLPLELGVYLSSWACAIWEFSFLAQIQSAEVYETVRKRFILMHQVRYTDQVHATYL